MTATQKTKVGLKEIAQQSGVSLATVSRALADHPQVGAETKGRILRASAALGYRPTRSTTKGRANGKQDTTKRFGYMVLGNRVEEINTGMLDCLIDHAGRHGIRLEVSAQPDTGDLAAVIRNVKHYAAGLDGLLLVGQVAPDVLDAINAMGKPCVIFGEIMADVDQAVVAHEHAHIVKMDDTRASRLATFRLLKLGHTRIAFICEYMLPGLHYHQWLSGWRLAYHDMGLCPPEELVLIAGKVWDGGGPAARAVCAMDNPPTAYIVPDGRTARSFVDEMRNLNHTVDLKTMVIGGSPDIAAKHRLTDCPFITRDNDRFAEAGIERLCQLLEKPSLCGTEITLSVVALNLPTLPE